MNDDLTKIYSEVETEVDRMRLLVHQHAHEYGKALRVLPQFGRAADWNGTYADIGFKQGQLNGIIIQIHLSKEETFKAAAPIIEWFVEEGWAQQAQYESAESGYREFTLTKEAPRPLFWTEGKAYPDRLITTIRIWPHSESRNCVRVEDGTQPKYKFVCEDES